jgi:HEAT repeat protein
VSWSSQVNHPDPEFLTTLVHTLNYDPNVDVRLAAVDAIARFAGYSTVRIDLVRSLPKQDSPLVQIALIDLLVQLHERQSVDAFKRIIEDTNQTRRSELALSGSANII